MAAGTKPGYQIERDDTGLTRREREVLMHLATGKTGQQTAEALGISKQRVDQIQKALVVKGRLERREHEYVVIVPRQA